ncbi:MAG: hypothetical protein U0163_03320 [Gemmatimonadaceae bacterium]
MYDSRRLTATADGSGSYSAIRLRVIAVMSRIRPVVTLFTRVCSAAGVLTTPAWGQGALIRELLPFRFEASSTFEADAFVNDVHRSDLDVRRTVLGVELRGRWRIRDGGIRSVCGDDPRDGTQVGQYAVSRTNATLPGLRVMFEIRYANAIGGRSSTRAPCPASDLRIVGSRLRLLTVVRSLEQIADTADHGRDLLFLNDLDKVGSGRAVAAGGRSLKEVFTRGGSLFETAGVSGVTARLGVDLGGDGTPRAIPQSTLARSATQCAPPCTASALIQADGFLTTLGHAIHAVGLSAVVDNRGRATIEQWVPFTEFASRLNAATAQGGVWICDSVPSCPVFDLGVAIHDLRLSGSGDDLEATFIAQRRLTDIGHHWSAPARVNTRLRVRYDDYAFRISELTSLVAEGGRDTQLAADIERGLRVAIGYALFPSWTSLEQATRPFGTVCLYPVSTRATIAKVVTQGALHLTLDVPISVQAIDFCPR